jgi:hypothetical protein
VRAHQPRITGHIGGETAGLGHVVTAVRPRGGSRFPFRWRFGPLQRIALPLPRWGSPTTLSPAILKIRPRWHRQHHSGQTAGNPDRDGTAATPAPICRPSTGGSRTCTAVSARIAESARPRRHPSRRRLLRWRHAPAIHRSFDCKSRFSAESAANPSSTFGWCARGAAARWRWCERNPSV